MDHSFGRAYGLVKEGEKQHKISIRKIDIKMEFFGKQMTEHFDKIQS